MTTAKPSSKEAGSKDETLTTCSPRSRSISPTSRDHLNTIKIGFQIQLE